METQQIKDKAGRIVDHTVDYLDTFVKLRLLKITRKTTNIVSGAIVTLVACLLGMFVLFFASLAAAWWLGDVIGSRTGGFLLLTSFYLVVVIALVLLRNKIIFPFIRNMLARKIKLYE